MASVPTAPNDSNDDRSGTENENLDDGNNESTNEDEDSDATVNLELKKAIQKNKDLAKQVKSLKAQSTRLVRQKEDTIRKHAQVLEIKKTVYEGAKTRHSAVVADLKASWKNREKDLRDTSRAELVSKSVEIRLLKNDVDQFERDKTSRSNLLEKLKASLVKEKSAHTELKEVYVGISRKLDGLTESNRELTTSLKYFKKKSTDDQSVKFKHDEKMLSMQLERESVMYQREKEKTERKEETDKVALQAKNHHTILAHSLRKQTKDEDMVRREIAKKKKDVQVSTNVGVIAASLRNKQMQINNGQFNARQSLEEVSFFLINFCFNLLLTFVMCSRFQSYDVLINNNTTMQHQHQTPQPNYPVQQWDVAPAFHRPTPSPVRRQETLTQCEWGARPIPAGWREARDGTGTKFYVHKRTNRWAPTYDHMFVDEVPNRPLSSISNSNSHSTSQDESGSQAGTPRKKKRRKEVEVIEVGTEQLPGSDFSLGLAQRKEAPQAPDDDKENAFENANQNDKNDSEGEDEEDDAEDDDDGSSQETTWPARKL
jgi:hypothetical protein